MLKFHAKHFIALIHTIGRFEIVLEEMSDKNDEIKVGHEFLLGLLNQLLEQCEAINFEFSALAINDLIDSVNEGIKAPIFIQRLVDIRNRIFDELKLNSFFHISKLTVQEYYEESYLFGEQVFISFSSANFDIEEAGKCFATARYTACVMHLMRCLEVGLKSLGLGLGIASITNPNWQTIINQVNSAIATKKATLGVAWKLEEEFYTNAVAHLFAVKNAWRNPTMHVEKKYTEEEAEDIFNAVKGFMRTLAGHLTEKGKFSKKKKELK